MTTLIYSRRCIRRQKARSKRINAESGFHTFQVPSRRFIRLAHQLRRMRSELDTHGAPLPVCARPGCPVCGC